MTENTGSPTCRTCVHWTEDNGWYSNDIRLEERDGETDDQHLTRQEAVNARYRTCKAVVMPDYGESEEYPPIAYVMDGSNYRADLRTLPDFGCVLHTAATSQGSPA